MYVHVEKYPGKEGKGRGKGKKGKKDQYTCAH